MFKKLDLIVSKSTFNKVMIQGRIGTTPELRYTPSNLACIHLNIATNDRIKKDNAYIDIPEWHKVVFFGRSAETIHKFSEKGTLLFIDGKLKTKKWSDKDGNDRYSTEIIGSEFQFISSPSKNTTSSNVDENTLISLDNLSTPF